MDMKTRSLPSRATGWLLARLGYCLVPNARAYEWQYHATLRNSHNGWHLPSDASAYLRPTNPRLRELQASYAQFGGPVIQPRLWTAEFVEPQHLLNFRGDTGYVWQTHERNDNELGYALTYYYTRSRDRLGLLDRLDEDGAFGAYVFRVDGRTLSRDLLDSVNELNFLDRHLGIGRRSGTVMLDIGAGYGRLAYRAVTGLHSMERYLCTDAIPASTFLCEYYLRYRGVEDRAQVVPLQRIESVVAHRPVHVAVNIHSWPECRVEAVAWWASLLARHRVPYVLIVTNRLRSDTEPMKTNLGEDLSELFIAAGYRLVAREPKYDDPVVQQYGVSPALYFLWAL
jgi:hypothetical protein